jgi:methionyl-tRNA synthetase
MAADLPLPKRIFAHGWLLFENDKMSKSRGNIVRATPIQEVMGMDALRYFLLREIPFGQDGAFSFDALVGRYNSDLANGLGNLVSRTLTMIRQYRNGSIADTKGDPAIAAQAKETVATALAAFNEFEFSKGLEAIWALLSAVDKHIVQQAPWTLAKKQDASAQATLDSTLYTAAEVVRIATLLLAPVIPESAARIWSQSGMATGLDAARATDLEWGGLRPGHTVGEPVAVFPRIDPKIAIPRLRELEAAESERQAILVGKGKGASADPGKTLSPELAPAIGIEDFAKVDMRVGIVVSAQPVKGADKLLHLQVDIGEPEPRSIVAGIALAYTPDKLVGRKVVIVANLQPRKLRGIPSNGMIVAASLEGDLPVLASFLEDVPVGARLK